MKKKALIIQVRGGALSDLEITRRHRYGEKQSAEAKKSISASLQGHEVPGATRAKIAGSLAGRAKPESTREAMRAAAKARKPAQVVSCPHCGKTGEQRGMTRYHFENCKEKP